MTLLDAYALIAWFGGEPCAPEVRALLDGGASITALNLAEVIDRTGRVHGHDVREDIAELMTTHLDVVPLDPDLGVAAGALRARAYDRRTAAVSMADCVAAVTALRHDLPLATSDPALAALVAGEGGTVVALPDSRGIRPGK